MITNKFLSKLNFALQKRRKWFYVPIVFVVLLSLKLIVIPLNEFWQNNFEVIATSAILIATIILAIGELNNDWEAHLPKRLTVIFTYKGLPVMKCKEAWLAGESDIRQWSQQIGKQMSDGEYLDFEPFVDQKESVEEQGEDFFKLYTTTFKVTKVPKKFESNYQHECMLCQWIKDKNKREEKLVKHHQA